MRFNPVPLLKRSAHIPDRARFPVVDAHNHIFGDDAPEEMIGVMDAVGVRVFVNLTGNITVPFENNCYTLVRRDFRVFADRYIKAYPGRFAAMTMADFAQWGDPVLVKDDGFADRCIRQLEADVALGACGLKITKELGLYFRDYDGDMLPVDDERLFPIWERAGELGIPVLMHVSDPVGFFLPADENNEHYPTLQEFPGWNFHGSHYSKWELLGQRDRLVARHPGTTFILPHVANNPEDLDYVDNLLRQNPNVYMDFSARIDELGRQPYSSRGFFIEHQDRILFGLDMPVSVEAYRCYFRFLETQDEYFDYPDYIGRWGNPRWRIYGLGLPDDVLRKIYSENVRRLIPVLGTGLDQ
jgi:predicted TIM-barrel fold metal-dependent hydrolase